MSELFARIGDFVTNGPFIAVFLFMTAGSFLRNQGMYWIGRYITHFAMSRGEPEGGWRLRAYRWAHSEATAKATEEINRRGWPIIPLSFLTVGVQSVVNFSAGVLRMRWLLYTLAEIPGAIAWGLIYSTIGWTVWVATMKTAMASPIARAVMGILLLLGIALIVRRVRSGREADQVEAPAKESAQIQ